MEKVISEVYRLRNENYQKWQESEKWDENRSVYKARFEAYDKVLDLLTPFLK